MGGKQRKKSEINAALTVRKSSEHADGQPSGKCGLCNIYSEIQFYRTQKFWKKKSFFENISILNKHVSCFSENSIA